MNRSWKFISIKIETSRWLNCSCYSSIQLMWLVEKLTDSLQFGSMKTCYPGYFEITSSWRFLLLNTRFGCLVLSFWQLWGDICSLWLCDRGDLFSTYMYFCLQLYIVLFLLYMYNLYMIFVVIFTWWGSLFTLTIML